jgi:hypothetical protein
MGKREESRIAGFDRLIWRACENPFVLESGWLTTVLHCQEEMLPMTIIIAKDVDIQSDGLTGEA